jgi:ectoine hydroxylase-related dioxygenase (phytanoyl-CoA dioxygenase family)
MSLYASLSRIPLLGMLALPLRRLVLDVRSLLVLPWGLRRFCTEGRTPEPALQAMIWLFCTSGGRFNDWMSWCIAKRNPPVTLPDNTGVLGTLDTPRLAELGQNLRRDGYLVFPSALSAEVCDRLHAFAARTPATIRPMDGQSADVTREALYEPGNPQAVRYDYQPSDLLDHPDVQDLLADTSLLSLVQEYLGCEPKADVLSMWWHTAFQDHPDSMAAQYFHFDMDRFKWLKVFIYLTDVGPDNGPHAFVRGSHRTGAIPRHILDRGYVRLTDKEVAATYLAEDMMTFTAPRGSIIVEDTRGLHKGVHVRDGARLILQLQFSNSLFGTNYAPARMSKVSSPRMKFMLERAPAIYRQYS